MIQIHDNNIYQIRIDCENREITFYTQSERKASIEFTNVIFSGVAAHHFLHTMQYNILFSIDQIDPKEFHQTQQEELALLQQYGLPLSFDSPEGLVQALAKQQLSIYYIGSSYGMSGWIIAKEMQVRPVVEKSVFLREGEF